MGEEGEISTPVVVVDMTETTATTTAAAPVASQSLAAKKSSINKKTKKRRPKPTHPKIAEMVSAAISAMKERHGSSFKAIKKYVSLTYNIDIDKLAPYVKKYLRAAVVSGILIRTRGQGVSGSFKLPAVRKSRSARPRTRAISSKSAAPKMDLRKPTAAKSPVAKKQMTKSKAIGGTRKIAVKGPAAKPPKAKTSRVKVVAKSRSKKTATPIKASVRTKMIKSPVKREKKMSARKSTRISGQ